MNSKTSSPIVFQVLLFLAAFLAIFSRRPDAIFNAQFFAEDGQRWFADAYQHGPRSLLIPDEAGGYMHTVPRLTALLALAFPLPFAPLVMNLCAIVIQILPISIFLSSRFSRIALRVRLVASFLYLALPNSFEVNANATTIQWHLALLACLVLFAEPASDWKWRMFDGFVLVLMSVESPMGILLVPVAGAMWWFRKSRESRILFGLLFPGAIVQAFVTFFSHARKLAPISATWGRLNRILARQVFLGSLIGKKAVLHLLLRHSQSASLVLEIAAAVLGLAILVYVLRYAPLEIRLFVLFGFTVLALGLTHPMPGVSSEPAWELMSFPGTGNRYYFLPMIAFLTSLCWIVLAAPSLRIRWLAGALLLFMPIGIVRDWEYPPFADLHFREYAARFEAAAPGTKVIIPINPVSAAHWTMELTKK
jgi:hypothetical protein